ncbi:MAG: amidohydrolase [Bacillota bacterium]|nr:amidohydrolase [Bacillota bacterium]MDO4472280.1 amidohydrolase [Bacillota bacterium]
MKQADLALINGSILSVKSDGSRIGGQAIAVTDGIISAVGSNELIREYIGNDTRVVDCEGSTILPGLCDAHCHPSISASAYSGCDLFGVYIQDDETEDEIIDEYLMRLKDFIEAHPGSDIIRGTGWVMGNFTGERVPTRHDIDKICSDKPVILESFCQHNLWVNTRAVELAGLDENIPDVYAGYIYREENGYPLGLFNDPEAMALIKDNVPGYDFSVEEYKESLLYYQKNHANRYGVTLVMDCMHSSNAREAYRQLAEEGKLTIRARGVYMVEPKKAKEQLAEYIARKGRDDCGDDFRIDTVKIFAEGMFSLVEPYEREFTEENNLPEDYNEPLYWDDEVFVETASAAMESGLNVHVHAMGDNAVKQSIRCLAKAQENTGIVPGNTIAHLMLVKHEDVDAMAEASIIANCQPRWMVYDSDIAGMLPLVGQQRAESAYPLRKLLDAGVRVAFGTDFPVTPPPDTMHEIQCAMTRSVFPDAPDYDSFKGRILGDERPAELEEAIQSLSINGAVQMWADEFTGSIEVGKSADLAVLDSNIENVPVDEIYRIKIAKTFFKGSLVYEK